MSINHDLWTTLTYFTERLTPSRHLTSVGRQIDVRLRRHNDVGFRLILKVCLTSKTDVILTSEKQRWFDVSNVTS